MYNEAHLIHADLSEYNILWHKNTCYFIDVSQAVEHEHENAYQFLYDDCKHITHVSEQVFQMFLSYIRFNVAVLLKKTDSCKHSNHGRIV